MLRRAAIGVSFALFAIACVVESGSHEEQAPTPQGGEVSVAGIPTLGPVDSGLPPVVSRRIRVYWHVIHVGPGTSQGSVADSQIENQVRVLNEAFEPGTFSFYLAAIDRTNNSAWYTAAFGTTAEREMKNALHQGTARDLNVYSTNVGNGFLNYATFPLEYASRPLQDGAVVHFSTLPGGSGAPYNLGHQLVHATGYWLGLYNTFQGGCTGSGDGVADTPAQKYSNYGCPEGKNSCPNQPGNDPIHNFMDFTDDACTNHFTPGQYTRMGDQFALYRANH